MVKSTRSRKINLKIKYLRNEKKKDINFRFEDADLIYANFCTLISFIEMHEGKLMVLKV